MQIIKNPSLGSISLLMSNNKIKGVEKAFFPLNIKKGKYENTQHLQWTQYVCKNWNIVINGFCGMLTITREVITNTDTLKINNVTSIIILHKYPVIIFFY